MANTKPEQEGIFAGKAINEGNSGDNNTKKDDGVDKAQKGELKKEQDKFIRDIKETEKLIDPGDEHHHHADDADKKIG